MQEHTLVFVDVETYLSVCAGLWQTFTGHLGQNGACLSCVVNSEAQHYKSNLDAQCFKYSQRKLF